MKLGAYLLDKIIQIVIYVISSILFLLILFAFNSNPSLLIAFSILSALAGIILLIYDCLRKRNFYNHLRKTLEDLDQKYLLSELTYEPFFYEGKILYEALWQTNKSMRDKIKHYEKQTKDFRDYIELWVHEVKTPLSVLTLGSSPDQPYLKEIENYIDQALFYSKINTTDQDYIVKKISLKKLVSEVIKKNKTALIKNNIKIELQDLDHDIFSDSKWLEFIINQIILNAIKYRGKTPTITIHTDTSPGHITLHITDNGVGIKPSELKHIFKKGFSGSNGRHIQSSTGMGLYISQKLAEDLGHKITATSEQHKFTTLSITFGDNKFYKTLQKR